jgi:hypothetical protein
MELIHICISILTATIKGPSIKYKLEFWILFYPLPQGPMLPKMDFFA